MIYKKNKHHNSPGSCASFSSGLMSLRLPNFSSWSMALSAMACFVSRVEPNRVLAREAGILGDPEECQPWLENTRTKWRCSWENHL